jgi:hypothetical protein
MDTNSVGIFSKVEHRWVATSVAVFTLSICKNTIEKRDYRHKFDPRSIYFQSIFRSTSRSTFRFMDNPPTIPERDAIPAALHSMAIAFDFLFLKILIAHCRSPIRIKGGEGLSSYPAPHFHLPPMSFPGGF